LYCGAALYLPLHSSHDLPIPTNKLVILPPVSNLEDYFVL
jgi:hypothetical protein